MWNEPLPRLGPPLPDRTPRHRFAPHELAGVLSHYDLDVIERIRVFPRGSRQAPKVRIWSRRGQFLLKRRAPGRDDPYRVAFAHGLQLHLGSRGLPVAPLVGTRDANNSMLQLDGRVYEVFKFVEGVRCDGSAAQARESGRMLGAMHRDVADFAPAFEPPLGGYHDAAGLRARLAQVPAAIAEADPHADRRAVADLCRRLADDYAAAAERVRAAGWADWPRRFTHGDWHPGNLIFRDGAVVAVLDFDSARHEPRAADVANAALQHSLALSARRDPARWPEGLETAKMREVLLGYGREAAHTMEDDEHGAMPWLMIEALVIESVVPIAATGRFGPIGGAPFLAMAARKIAWIAARADELVEMVRR